MYADIAEKWAAKLESGEYPQTTGTLRRRTADPGTPPVGLCCLGVLCELAIEEGLDIEVRADSDKYYTGYDGAISVLPITVQQWAGMHSENGQFKAGRCLTEDNDGGASFTEIAATIRANVEVL